MENGLNDEGIPYLPLELDFENIPTEDYREIVVLFKYCPSLVNEDIVSVSQEIISRIETTHFVISKGTYQMINNLYIMLEKIPDTSLLIDRFIMNCPWISKSPAVEPVASPKIMKKMKVKAKAVISLNKAPTIMKKEKCDYPLKYSSYLCSR
tara:strand:+ start:487 stop:942 length:456 start_codon:yes stop_codon:yes gene_type:complete